MGSTESEDEAAVSLRERLLAARVRVARAASRYARANRHMARLLRRLEILKCEHELAQHSLWSLDQDLGAVLGEIDDMLDEARWRKN